MKGKNHPVRVALYIRIGNITATSFDVATAQEANFRLSAENTGETIVGVYKDLGIAGDYPNRPGLFAMLTAAGEGAFDKLRIMSTRTLHCDAYIVQKIIDYLNARGIAVQDKSGEIN